MFIAGYAAVMLWRPALFYIGCHVPISLSFTEKKVRCRRAVGFFFGHFFPGGKISKDLDNCIWLNVFG